MKTKIKTGDQVKMTKKYIEYESHKNEVFEVTSEPWMCCGTEVVYLKGFGSFAADGLKIVT